MTRVLFLCTANQCRSPMAEGLLRARRPDLEVGSAGRLPGGVPASPAAVVVLAERGIDLSAHRSRTASPQLVSGADLVLGMGREHVRDAVLLHAAGRTRAFTLRDLVRRARAAGPRPPEVDVGAWATSLGADRSTADLLGASDDDDVRDPIGQPIVRYRACVELLDVLLADLDRLVLSVAPPSGGDGLTV